MKRRTVLLGILATTLIIASFLVYEPTGSPPLPTKPHGYDVNVNTPFNHSLKMVDYYKGFDIMGKKQFKFLPQYKNPCWFDRVRNERTLFCLPYFYLIGVKKSGTSDLYFRLLGHPDIAYPGFKESQWLADVRFSHPVVRSNGLDVRTPLFYASMYSPAAEEILSKPGRLNGTFEFPIITGDGSPSNLYKNYQWTRLPGNEGRAEPRYTHLDYLHHLTPNAKIIIIMRDPVSRLESDYYFLTKKKRSPSQFHEHVVLAVSLYSECLQQSSLRRCAYNQTIRKLTPEFEFSLCFYAFYMRELRKLFPEENILPLLTQDYVDSPGAVLRKVFDFLELSPVSDQMMQRILAMKRKNKGFKHEPMFKKTRRLLEEFLAPYNKDMASLMKDSRYLFSDVQS